MKASPAVWLYSWHMKDGIMQCKGEMDQPGALILTGSYKVETGPDWGWRIEIDGSTTDKLLIRMFNISSGNDETLVVFTELLRE